MTQSEGIGSGLLAAKPTTPKLPKIYRILEKPVPHGAPKRDVMDARSVVATEDLAKIAFAEQKLAS